MGVRFSRPARSDLVAIYRYIGDVNPASAARVIANLKAQCVSLARLPERGVLIALRTGGTARRLVEGPYVIVYDIDAQGVRIARILHGSGDIMSILDDARPQLPSDTPSGPHTSGRYDEN